MAGVIIDDFILMERVSLDAAVGLELEERRRLMHSMYGKVGLEAHPTKGFLNCTQAIACGELTLMVSLGLFELVFSDASLAWVTSRVASLCLCSVSLQVLAGGFVSIFGFRRRMLSLLDLVYAAQGGRDDPDIVEL